MDEIRSIFQTKTFWLNLLGPIFLMLNNKYGIQLDADQQLAICVILMGIANIIMRRFTSTPVKILPAEPK